MPFDFGNANEQQKKAIQCTEGPLLIIAGPGTGKTFTLVKRIIYLITELKVQPEEIMVATFTEKAAKELITRITNELLNVGVTVNINDMYIGTFHSICLRIIKEHLEFTRIKKNYRMLDQFDQQYMIFQHIGEFRQLKGFETLFAAKSAWWQAGQIAKYVNNFIEELVDVDRMLTDTNSDIAVVAQIIKLYSELLEKENLIDFSSIQTEAYWLLKKHTDILTDLQHQLKYIMVDEYQDTNYIQELLIFLLANEKRNICVVGDDDQGLYRFRGATIRNILEFPKHFEDKICNRIDLTINYRSEKQIIDFYNEWMTQTEGKSFGFDWNKYRFNKQIIPGKKNYRRDISVIKCSSKNSIDEWYRRVLDFIMTLKEKEVLTDYNQMAFLCRSVKNEKIIGLIQYLEQHGISVYSPRSELFFERKEVKEIFGCIILCFPQYLSKLRKREFAYNFEKLYQYYSEDCVKAANELIVQYDDTLGLWIEKNQIRHEDLKENTDYAFTGLMYQLFAFEPFCTYLGMNPGCGVADERPARNISILSAVLSKFEYLHRIDVFTPQNIVDISEKFFNMYLHFLYEGGINEYEDDTEYAPSGCISFMTIHQSKGMEFPIVLVDSLDTVPRTSSDILVEQIEERYFHRPVFEARNQVKFFDFWRLYYTAFSRAQNLLVLSCYEKGGRGATPSKYFEQCYQNLKEYDEVNLSSFKLDMVKPVNIKDTFSFTSHIQLYENCALQYKFFKELGFTQIRVGATLFGTLVHETIEDIHRAAIRKEESTITSENVRTWFEENYNTLSKNEHSYLGRPQLEAAYNQIMRYVEKSKRNWAKIQDAEVEVSLVKPDYILKGKVDLIMSDGDMVEVIDFKSEKRPDTQVGAEALERYRRQLEVYAHLIEQKTGKKVSKMHLYYTGEDSGIPTITFKKSNDSIDNTIKQFDTVVERIHNKDYSKQSKNKTLCSNCDMRFYCRKK